jgi:hypothetical protein
MLLGVLHGSKIHVTSAYPICHESLTKPLLEAALAVTLSSLEDGSSNCLVGWYTVPELVGDARPSPTVLRILAGLEGVIANPVLVTLSKLSITNIASKTENGNRDLVQAFGKNFGGQYMGKIKASITSESKTLTALEDLAEHESICDLVDHWASPKTEWPNTAKVNRHLS